MSRSIFPGIPEPTPDLGALHVSVLALKQSVEILTRQKGALRGAVTWQDLVDLGLIQQDQVPSQ